MNAAFNVANAKDVQKKITTTAGGKEVTFKPKSGKTIIFMYMAVSETAVASPKLLAKIAEATRRIHLVQARFLKEHASSYKQELHDSSLEQRWNLKPFDQISEDSINKYAKEIAGICGTVVSVPENGVMAQKSPAVFGKEIDIRVPYLETWPWSPIIAVGGPKITTKVVQEKEATIDIIFRNEYGIPFVTVEMAGGSSHLRFGPANNWNQEYMGAKRFDEGAGLGYHGHFARAAKLAMNVWAGIEK